MTAFLLIRHALCDPVGRVIAGRAAGTHLNDMGLVQVARLADALGAEQIDAVYSSPLERAQATARPIAQRHGLEVELSPALEEVDFGRWTGADFAALDRDVQWHRFNTFRSGTRAPGGEHALETQLRVVLEVDRLHARHDGGTVALVSHGDVIRALLVYYLGMPLDFLLRLEVDPASVSVLERTADQVRVVRVNVPVARP